MIRNTNLPIPETVAPTRTSWLQSLKNVASKVYNPVKKFTDWVTSFVPENIRETVSRKTEGLKESVHRILEPEDEFHNALEYQDDSEELEPIRQEHAFNNYLSTHRIKGLNGYDPTSYLSTIKNRVYRFWEDNLKNGSWKIKTILTSKFYMKDQATGEVTDTSYCHAHSLVYEVTEETDLHAMFDEMTRRQLANTEKFQSRNTPWVFEEVMWYDIHMDTFESMTGSSYIELPEKLGNKHAIINVKNTDDHECFKWAITSAVRKQKTHPERRNKLMRKDAKQFDWTGISFPTPFNQIKIFEKNNSGYEIWIFGWKNEKVYPIRPGKDDPNKTKIDLLYLKNEETKHYIRSRILINYASHKQTNTKKRNTFADGEYGLCTPRRHWMNIGNYAPSVNR